MIRWLHVSDLHHGQAGLGGRWPELREQALADIRAQVAERGQPDLLIFTGDLAYSGADEEYLAVEATLADIREALGCDPLILPVPGNHDLKRPGFQWPLTGLGLQYYNDLKRPILERNEEIHAALSRMFGGYQKWWRDHVEPQWRRRDLRVHPGLFPGDFRLALSIGDIDLAVVGINSAVRHHTDDRSPPLVVEVEQCGREFERWVNKHEAALLLMHHPVAWLDRDVQYVLTDRIYPKDRFVACLCGHMHASRADVDGARRWLQASSLFGLEHYGTQNEQRVSGYAWGALERIDATRARLFQWGRRFSPTAGFAPEPDCSFPNGVEVPLRSVAASNKLRIALIASATPFRTECANELDTYSDVSTVTEVDPRGGQSAAVGGASRTVVLLDSTTVRSPLLNSCVGPTSLILRTPFTTDGGDPDVLRDALILSREHPDAQVCHNPREAAAAVRAWLNVARRSTLQPTNLTAAPTIADAKPSDDAMSSWIEIDAVNEKAKADFDAGRFDDARIGFRNIVSSLTGHTPETVEGHERLTKAHLNLAACALSLGQNEEATTHLHLVSTDGLSGATLVHLVTLWSNLGELERARAILPLLDPTDAPRMEQLIGLREGKLPETLDPALGLEACEVLLAQGRIAEAAETAMKELDGASD